MANENNIDGLISTNNTQIQSSGLVIPTGFNDTRSPNELSRLFKANSTLLYTKYSYYTADGYGKNAASQQPFFAVNPGNLQVGALKSNSALNTKKKTDSRTSPFISSDEDVIRIRKFLGTSAGTKFTTTQFLLQGFQPFNETKIYNPLMPIIASARPGTLRLISRPNRFVELNASGIFGALGLKAVSTVLFGNSNPTPPPGTATGQPATFFNSINPFSSRLPGALPVNRQDGGKGLTRGKSATDAYKNFTDYWSPTSRGLGGRLLSAVGNYIRGSTAIGALVPIGQPKGTKFKADESSYDLMIRNGVIKKSYSRPGIFDRIKNFFVGSSPSIPRFVWTDVNGNQQYGLRQKWAGGSIEGMTKYRYVTLDDFTTEGLESEILQNYGDYIDNVRVRPSFKAGMGVYPTKLDGLQNSSIQLGLGGGSNNWETLKKQKTTRLIYGQANKEKQSKILANYNDYINNIRGRPSSITGPGVYPTKLDDPQNSSIKLLNFQLGLERESNNWKTLKKQKTTHPGDRLQPKSVSVIVDDENSFTYLNRFKDKLLKKQLLEHLDGKELRTDVLDPINTSTPTENDSLFKDRDLVRFWFYDIANNKYIPFRATVKAINERYTSDWDNFQYVGNADKVYNYKGFTRSLGFSFSVVAMSVLELKPMWTRINYLLGLSKPAKYFDDEFIVPPLVKMTIGDMYKDQPIIITNMSLSIPDNATWETLPQETNQYNYSHKSIIYNNVQIAQFPMEADLTIDCNLLEINKPQVMNTNNFGWKELVTS
jgi:hypothetical protein